MDAQEKVSATEVGWDAGFPRVQALATTQLVQQTIPASHESRGKGRRTINRANRSNETRTDSRTSKTSRTSRASRTSIASRTSRDDGAYRANGTNGGNGGGRRGGDGGGDGGGVGGGGGVGDMGQGGDERIDGGAAVGVESGRGEEIRLRPTDIDFRGLKRRVTQFAQLLTNHGLCAVGIGGRNFLSGERKENRSDGGRMDSRTSRTN